MIQQARLDPTRIHAANRRERAIQLRLAGLNRNSRLNVHLGRLQVVEQLFQPADALLVEPFVEQHLARGPDCDELAGIPGPDVPGPALSPG